MRLIYKKTFFILFISCTFEHFCGKFSLNKDKHMCIRVAPQTEQGDIPTPCYHLGNALGILEIRAPQSARV